MDRHRDEPDERRQTVSGRPEVDEDAGVDLRDVGRHADHGGAGAAQGGGRLFQQDYAIAKLDLSNFGASVRIALPPQSEVSHP